MSRSFVAPLATCALVCAACLAPPPPATIAAEARTAEAAAVEEAARNAVLDLIEDQVAAWNRGDVEAFVAAYAEDCVFLSPTGVTRGRAEVLARYRSRYPDAAAMGRLTLEPLDVRFGRTPNNGPVTAVSVGATWRLEYPDEDRDPAEGLTLIVFVPTPDGTGWHIVQDASM